MERCRLNKLIRQRFAFALKIQQMLFAMVISSSRELQWIQSQAKRCRLNKLIRQRFAFALKIQQMLFAMVISSSRKMMYQSRATVDPVPGYRELQPVDKESSRELQCIQSRTKVLLHIHSTWNPDVGKADVVKSCNQPQSIQSSKKPDAVIEESTSSEAVDELRRVTKAECQLLSFIQMLNTTKGLQKKGHKGQSLSSRAIVDPVAGYRELQPVDKESSRELQCIQSRTTVLLHIQSTWNPDAGKADVVKSCNQAQSIQSSKKPDALIEESTSSEAVDELRRVTKAECQLLSFIQMLKTKKGLQKKGHKGQSLSSLNRDVKQVPSEQPRVGRSLGVLAAAGCGIGSVHVVLIKSSSGTFRGGRMGDVGH
ncbi:hypothetical protein F511_24292 [Dorcoceras hygrometricum]|uniref:Uncharacterized protein n=1 Tax=Dorcoceras hygrometricum TaxID=472368 RepID=A0A2Z7BXW6_9LAMI|nr:hypothetical protein F511_24292 [Dorcoceras hygrometricum]